MTGPDLEKNGMDGGSGWGMVADPEPDWIRIQSVQVYPDPEKSDGDESWEVRWVGGWGRRRVDPN